jgi:uncharacterized protein YrrD
MLRRFEDLRGFTLRALDGDIGRVTDLYFHDDDWQVRYFVVDTGSWLFGRRVLISPYVLHQPDWETSAIPVDLTQEQVENSPDIDLDQPVSRQHQTTLHAYYSWPIYWAGDAMVGAAPIPPAGLPVTTGQGTAGDAMPVGEDLTIAQAADDPHLYSAREVIGYHIQATDDEIGRVDDLFVGEEDWVIRYIMVDTGSWLPGRKVLIVPDKVQQINWEESRVYVNYTRQQVKDSPEFDPKGSISRSHETSLYDYYGYPYYWL